MKIILISLIFSSFCSQAQELGETFETSTNLRNPFNLRDPFKVPKINKTREKQENKLLDKGILDNSPRTNSLRLDSIILKGVVWQGDNKKAIFEGGQGSSVIYVLTEGAVISNGKVTLKAILPKSVIFVEKIINVYGQAEYLETVVSISG